MFIDDNGNEFETEKDIENFARKEFYKDENTIIEYLKEDFYTEELLKWIFKNDKEKFLKDHKNLLKDNEDGFAYDYFIIHDIEEV